jgi:hypothetical protein
MVRNGVRLTAPQAVRKVQAGDILIIEAEVLASLLSSLGPKLEEAGSPGSQNETGDTEEKTPPGDEAVLMAFVIPPESSLIGGALPLRRLLAHGPAGGRG